MSRSLETKINSCSRILGKDLQQESDLDATELAGVRHPEVVLTDEEFHGTTVVATVLCIVQVHLKTCYTVHADQCSYESRCTIYNCGGTGTYAVDNTTPINIDPRMLSKDAATAIVER